MAQKSSPAEIDRTRVGGWRGRGRKGEEERGRREEGSRLSPH